MDLLERAYSPEIFRQQGHQLVDVLANYLAKALSASPELPVNHWQAPEQQYCQAAENLLLPDTLAWMQHILHNSIHLHHPRFMGHQVCPPAPITALASMMTALLNNGMAVYEMGAPATALERLLIEQVAAKLGFDVSIASGFLTSGGTLANLTALLAARSHYAGTDVWRKGHTQPLALMVSEQAHYCVDRAARIMGWGEQGTIKIPVNERSQLRIERLESAYLAAQARGIQVIAVVGSACTTSTGSFDDLEAIGQFCRQHELWFHVDGAHGAAVAFSARHRHLVQGIEQADSIALDFHKMLMTPALVTALVFRQGERSYRTFSQQAEYLFGQAEPEWYNVGKRSLECTKLMMSVKAWALWQSLGPQVFEAYVDKVIANSATFAEIIRQRPCWELAVEPQCNIVCFRYRPLGLSDTETDALNAHIRQRLLEDGRFYIVQTTLHHRTWLRVTLVNPFTQAEDLETLLAFCEAMAKR